MKTYITTLYYREIPIWSDVVFSNTTPDLIKLNEKFGMFGDKMFAREITDRCILRGFSFRKFATV